MTPHRSPRLAAVIFDMDGVLSDTQSAHATAESDLLATLGIRLSPDELSARFAGVNDTEMFARMLADAGRSASIADLIDLKWRTLYASTTPVAPMSGALDLIRTLQANRIPLALASASRRPFVERVLRDLNVTDAFSAVVTGQDVPAGKPDPAIFLEAATRLG